MIEGGQFFDSEQVKQGTEGDFVIPAELIKIDRPVTTEEKNIALLQLKKNDLLNQLELLEKEIQELNKEAERQAQQN